MFERHYTSDMAKSAKPTPPAAASKTHPSLAPASAEWIAHVRKDVARLSQLEFAARVGANRVTISNWESGKFIPEWDSVERIVKAFPAATRPPFGPQSHAASMSDSSGKVAPATNQGDHRNDIHALLEEELRRRGKAISDDARKALATAIRSRRYGPQNADEARDYIDGLLEVFADASRGESR